MYLGSSQLVEFARNIQREICNHLGVAYPYYSIRSQHHNYPTVTDMCMWKESQGQHLGLFSKLIARLDQDGKMEVVCLTIHL